MVICMVALLLPESLWAQTTIKTSAPSIVISSDGTTLTINSTAAGDLAAFMSNVGTDGHVTTTQKTSMSANTIKTLVFKGTFNESDLQTVKYDNSNSFPIEPTTVDMSDAQFVRARYNITPTSYMWFKNTPPTGSANTQTHAFTQGTLYQLTYPRVWNGATPSTDEQRNGATLYSTIDAMNADKTGTIGRWARVPKNVYRQMTINSQSWSKYGASLGENEVALAEVDWLATDANLSDVTKLSQYQNNDIISVKEYYKVVKIDPDGNASQGNLQWSGIVYPTSEELSAEGVTVHIAEWVGAVYGHLEINEYTKLGDYICFHVYYRKLDNRSWSGSQTATPDGTVVNADFLDTERNNYMRYANGTWVRMIDYDYYQLALDNSTVENRTWTEITNVNKVDNAKYHFSAINSEEANTAKNSGNNGDYAIVGGNEFVFTGSEWVTIGDWGSTSTVFDYSVMKFSYWKTTITTAITSRYANESIDGDIFQECKSITHIDFLGGNVKGLNDRTTTGENPYAEFTVTIGKDVTKISQAAFSQSPALTGVEFGGYAEGDAQSMVYPKDLVIEDQAFKYCRNLPGITIPNRCTNIGDYAFQEVGNGTQTSINDARDNYDTNRKFELKFERRRQNDDSTVKIDCDRALTIGSSAFLDCWYLKTLSLPIRLESLGTDCFKNSIGLHEIIMREETKEVYTPPFGHDLLRTIPSGAFHGSSVEEITIPKCVTLIENGAFGATTNIKKIKLQTNTETTPGKTLVIKEGAFSGGRETERPQLDIYVDVLPSARLIVCEYKAFNYTQTVGQTNTNGGVQSFATLHFPEAAWNYYQGDWKRGLAFRQDNLNAFKDGYMNDEPEIDCIGKSNGTINYSTGYYETGNSSTQYTPANGWQEFARTSTNIDIDIPRGSFMRTYSTKTAYAIPVFAEKDDAYGISAGDPMFKIYRISTFSDDYDPNSNDYQSASQAGSASRVATAKEVEDKVDDTRYIPVNTGLLMVGKINTNYLVYLAAAPTGANKTYPYRRSGDDANLLYPACIDQLKYMGTFTNGSEDDIAEDEEGQPYLGTYNDASYVFLKPTSPYPYYGSHPSFRFFAFNATKNQFVRFNANGKAARDKAFLKLPYDMFHWANECGDGSGNTGSTSGVDKPIEQNEQQQSAPIMLSFYDMGGELTDVRTIDFNTFQEIKSDAYYTLQGVKISGRPTQQGIYIHNGKKVVIK